MSSCFITLAYNVICYYSTLLFLDMFACFLNNEMNENYACECLARLAIPDKISKCLITRFSESFLELLAQ